jgi:hypothetical protein
VDGEERVWGFGSRVWQERKSKEPSFVLRPRSWTRPSKEQEERFRRVAPKFFVPTLRVQVGKNLRLEARGKRSEERRDQREYEIKREGETSIENTR